MGSDDTAPLLPGDWEPVEEDRARTQRARREHDLDTRRGELTVEFRERLQEDEFEPDEVIDATRMIGDLLRLKADELDSPDPLEWSEELMVQLVTEVFPRELPDGGNDPRDAASTLLRFVGFLDATGRWRKRPLRQDEATVLLAHIAWPDPEDWGPPIALP